MKIIITGCVTPMGNDETTIWTNLVEGQEPALNRQLAFKSVLPGKIKRRNSRFSDLCAYAAIKCMRTLEEKHEVIDRDRIGCIFTTDFGPLETNLEFARQVAQYDPDLCSPSVFANTVHNSCLASISIELAITGPSTMMLGSNQILLAKMLLEENKADVVLAGAVEEYVDELHTSLVQNGFTSTKVSEGAVVLALGGNENEEGVCISQIKSISIGTNPYESNADFELSTKVAKRIIDFLKVNEVEAVIINDEELDLGKRERTLLSEQLPQVMILDGYYDTFGHTLGCDLGMKVLLAKICIEHGEVPGTLIKNKGSLPVKKIGVLSSSITGNYSMLVLEK